MKPRPLVLMFASITAFALAGCGIDVAEQLTTNEQVRTKVLDALAANKDLATKTLDRFMSNDTLRVQLVDHMLQNEEGAKQVLVRIGTNPDALDMVMGVAVRDSAMRSHVLTLVKGIELANKAK